jgi:phosphoglycolate phosphatase
MTFRLAIFDFDGTLANTYPVFVTSLHELAATHRFRHPAPDEERKLRGMSVTEVMRELQLPLWRVPAVLTDYRKIMGGRIDEIHPFAGVAEALLALQAQKVELALATSNTLDNVIAVLGAELLERFVAVECGTALFGKAQRLRRILKETQADRAQAIYIGDEIRDADAAHRVGVRFGAVAWGYTSIDALLDTNPDRVFRAPADLLELGHAQIES